MSMGRMTGMDCTGRQQDTREHAQRRVRELARQNREHVRWLLEEKQPVYAFALELVERELCYPMGRALPDERNAASCCRAV